MSTPRDTPLPAGTVVLTLVPLPRRPDEPAPEIGLRWILKDLRRRYGWRCVSVREVAEQTGEGSDEQARKALD